MPGRSSAHIPVAQHPAAHSQSRCTELYLIEGVELALAALARGSMTFMNPAGHSWVILAVPGSDEAEESRNTARILRGEFSIFDAADTLAQSADQRTKVYLARGQYHGAGILARALLGSGQPPYD